MASTPSTPLSVTVWNVGRHEQTDAAVIAMCPGRRVTIDEVLTRAGR